MLVNDQLFLKGTVVAIKNYGAFVRLEDGRVGMVHVSQLSDDYISDIFAFIQPNQSVSVRILSDGDKLSLSMRPLKTETMGQENSSDFEKLMAGFKKQSLEVQTDYSRYKNKGKSRSKRR